MSRILVIGGYGGFGARLSRRLIARGQHVLVGGRSAAKAAAFCAGRDATPVLVDRNADLAPILARHRPDLVIDAAGPFQDSDYRVPHARIAAHIPYLDLADARAFVTGIGQIHADVPVVAGASSVPALSGAVARRLAAGLGRVRSVEIAISASNRATAGRSVAASILSYVGRPIPLRRHRRSATGWGWQALRRESVTAGCSTLAGRWVALADVPDAVLLPDMLPGRPAVTFRAGTDIALQTIGLWLLSWAVRLCGCADAPCPGVWPACCSRSSARCSGSAAIGRR